MVGIDATPFIYPAARSRDNEYLASYPGGNIGNRVITPDFFLWTSVNAASPDNRWLALVSDQPREDLYVAAFDGSGLRQLTNDAALDRFPRWSADGRRISFQSNRGGAWDAWVINVDGSGLAPLTKNADLTFPSWSPDGSRMVFFKMLPDRPAFIFDPRVPWETQVPERLPAASTMPGSMSTATSGQ